MSSPASRRYLDRPGTPLLIVLSGPSGAGKDAVLARMKEVGCPLDYIVTLTTRPRRPNETDGVHYRFVSVADFHRLAGAGDLLEFASVYGNWYGTPRQDVRQGLAAGKDTIVKVDVQGAASIRKLAPESVLIFITPPSVEELVERLRQRRTESTFDLELRLRTAEAEYERVPVFDYLVLNRHDEIDRAVGDIMAIIAAEKNRVTPRIVSL